MKFDGHRHPSSIRSLARRSVHFSQASRIFFQFSRACYVKERKRRRGIGASRPKAHRYRQSRETGEERQEWERERERERQPPSGRYAVAALFGGSPLLRTNGSAPFPLQPSVTPLAGNASHILPSATPVLSTPTSVRASRLRRRYPLACLPAACALLLPRCAY